MILAALLLATLVLVVLLVRNERVLAYRLELLELVSAAARADVRRASLAELAPGAGDQFWEWRYDAFRRVSYNRMVLTPWRPLRWQSYWPDDSFIDPEARQPQWV